MSDLVDPGDIEMIVGSDRHQVDHRGRAVSAEQRVYILHSHRCRERYRDLRECPYSKVLDRGIDLEHWAGFEDQPVRLWISVGTLKLVPLPLRSEEEAVLADEICHGHHVWVLRGRIEECSRCGLINDEERSENDA